MMKGNTQSRAGRTGATGRRFAALVFIFLSNLVIARAQNAANPSTNAANPPASATDARITSLLLELADQARASDDPAFAVRAQAEAASLLWSRDTERAR